jgi:hypothetical protein
MVNWPAAAACDQRPDLSLGGANQAQTAD